MSITIKSIETKPQLDPYHRDTGKATLTYIKLYPEDRELYVVQEYDDNATPSDEWHGLVRTWRVYTWPLEEDMQYWLEQHMNLFATVADGFSRKWDGNNMVGVLTEEANAADTKISELLNDGFSFAHEGYSLWSTNDWMYNAYAHQITPETTDEQLEEWARDAEMVAEDDHIVLTEPAIEWLKRQREYA